MIQTIIGKRGRGKTTLAKNLIKISQAKQIIILDYLGEYGSLKDNRIKTFRYIQEGDLYDFCKFAWEESSPSFRTLVIFDEIDLYGRYDQKIAFLYRYGRHKNIDLIGVSRRFFDLPVIVRALTDEYIFFQITEERDIQYLKRLVKDDYIQKLINLPKYKYIKLSL